MPFSCELLEGIGDVIGRQGYPLGRAATTDTIMAFAAEHVKRERKASADLILQDRCLLDLLAYARSLDGVGEPCVRLVEELCLCLLSKASAVFYVPIPDARRTCSSPNEDAELRVRIDREVREGASALGLEVISVPGEGEARTAHVMAIIVAIVAESPSKSSTKLLPHLPRSPEGP